MFICEQMLLQVLVNTDQSNAIPPKKIALRKIKFAYRPEAVASLSEAVVSFRFLAFWNSSRDCKSKNARSLAKSHFLSSYFTGWNLCRIIIITIITKYFPPYSKEEEEEFRESWIRVYEKKIFIFPTTKDAIFIKLIKICLQFGNIQKNYIEYDERKWTAYIYFW